LGTGRINVGELVLATGIDLALNVLAVPRKEIDHTSTKATMEPYWMPQNASDSES
jgi:hypothetical protein